VGERIKLTTRSVRPGVARQDEVRQRGMELAKLATLRHRPPPLPTEERRLVFVGVRLDVEQELDQVPESVEAKKLLALADSLKRGFDVEGGK